MRVNYQLLPLNAPLLNFRTSVGLEEASFGYSHLLTVHHSAN